MTDAPRDRSIVTAITRGCSGGEQIPIGDRFISAMRYADTTAQNYWVHAVKAAMIAV